MGASITSEDMRELEKGFLKPRNIKNYRTCYKRSKNCCVLTCNTITACCIGCGNYIYEYCLLICFYISSWLE